MIWYPAPDPKEGEYRTVRRFAWFPVTLISGARLWLERYYETEQWVVDRGWEYDDTGWRVVSRTTFDPSGIITGAQPVAEPTP